MSDTHVWFPGWQFHSSIFQPLQSQLPGMTHITLDYANESGPWQDWLDRQHEAVPERAHLIGWSLGGMLALEMARHRPDINSVTLLCANVRFSGGCSGLRDAIAEDFRSRYRSRREAALKRFLSLVEGQSRHQLTDHLLTGDQSATLDWLYELDLAGEWISCPVRVLLAEADQLVPARPAAEAWLDLGAEVKLMPGSHHLPWQQPQAVAEWIRSHD